MLDDLSPTEIALDCFISLVASGISYIFLVSTFGPDVPLELILFSALPVNVASLFGALLVFCFVFYILVGLRRRRHDDDFFPDDLPDFDTD
jgi:hypothetical protein